MRLFFILMLTATSAAISMEPGTSKDAYRAAVPDFREELISLNHFLDALTINRAFTNLRHGILTTIPKPKKGGHSILTQLTTGALSLTTFLVVTAKNPPTRVFTEQIVGFLENIDPLLASIGAVLVTVAGLGSYCIWRKARAYTDARLRQELLQQHQEIDTRLEEAKKEFLSILQQWQKIITTQIEARSEADHHLQESRTKALLDQLVELSKERLARQAEELEKHVRSLEEQLATAQQKQREQMQRLVEELTQTHSNLQQLQEHIRRLSQANELLMKEFVPDVLAKIDEIARQCEKIAHTYQVTLEKKRGSSCLGN